MMGELPFDPRLDGRWQPPPPIRQTSKAVPILILIALVLMCALVAVIWIKYA